MKKESLAPQFLAEQLILSQPGGGGGGQTDRLCPTLPLPRPLDFTNQYCSPLLHTFPDQRTHHMFSRIFYNYEAALS